MNARKMYVRKWNKDNKWKATRKQNLKVERGLTFMSADVCPDVNIRDRTIWHYDSSEKVSEKWLREHEN